MPNKVAYLRDLIDANGRQLPLKVIDNGDGTFSAASVPSGVQPQYDDTDKLAVSLYGTNAQAGDTAIAVSPSGAISVELRSGQSFDTFEEWAVRQGYITDAFSGEVPVPTTGETTMLDVTIPSGQTWYRRYAFYSVVGARVGRFKAYRTIPPAAEAYFNLQVVRSNDSREIQTEGKYPTGSRFRVAVVADALAGAGDLVSARAIFIALPWVE